MDPSSPRKETGNSGEGRQREQKTGNYTEPLARKYEVRPVLSKQVDSSPPPTQLPPPQSSTTIPTLFHRHSLTLALRPQSSLSHPNLPFFLLTLLPLEGGRWGGSGATKRYFYFMFSRCNILCSLDVTPSSKKT